MFIANIGEDASDQYDELNFDCEEDKKKVDIVIEKTEEFFVDETLKANKSYKFHLRKQDAPERIDSYIASL